MERCPQHIAIPEKLKLVANEIGGPKTEAIFAMRRSGRPQDVAKQHASKEEKRV